MELPSFSLPPLPSYLDRWFSASCYHQKAISPCRLSLSLSLSRCTLVCVCLGLCSHLNVLNHFFKILIQRVDSKRFKYLIFPASNHNFPNLANSISIRNIQYSIEQIILLKLQTQKHMQCTWCRMTMQDALNFGERKTVGKELSIIGH